MCREVFRPGLTGHDRGKGSWEVAAVRQKRAQPALIALPFLVIGAVALTGILAGARSGVLPLLVLGPAAAALTCGLWVTVTAGVTADALCSGLYAYQGLFQSNVSVMALVAVLGVSGAAVAWSALGQHRARELATVRTVAEAAQQLLLRPLPPDVGSVSVAVRYISATAGARIGGDLYEVVETRNGARLMIGDVQGRGLPAVQTAAAVLSSFREADHDATDLSLVTARIEKSLARQLSEEEFVTAILAEVSPDGTAVRLLNCGHPPPMLISGGLARLAMPPTASLPLGLATMADAPRQVGSIALRPGDRLLFYTDGISEARSPAGEFFSLSGCRAMRECPDPEKALDILSDQVVRHVGHDLGDDAAMLMISRPVLTAARQPAGWPASSGRYPRARWTRARVPAPGRPRPGGPCGP